MTKKWPKTSTYQKIDFTILKSTKFWLKIIWLPELYNCYLAFATFSKLCMLTNWLQLGCFIAIVRALYNLLIN